MEPPFCWSKTSKLYLNLWIHLDSIDISFCFFNILFYLSHNFCTLYGVVNVRIWVLQCTYFLLDASKLTSSLWTIYHFRLLIGQPAVKKKTRVLLNGTRLEKKYFSFKRYGKESDQYWSICRSTSIHFYRTKLKTIGLNIIFWVTACFVLVEQKSRLSAFTSANWRETPRCQYRKGTKEKYVHGAKIEVSSMTIERDFLLLAC